jgi:PUA domain protein
MAALKRYRLRKDQLKKLIQEVNEEFGHDLTATLDKCVEITEIDRGIELISVDGRALLFRAGGKLVPTLSGLDAVGLRHVTVDMGAVPYVANGADVMGPGIVSVDDGIREGDTVAVVDERHGVPLAVGVALVAGDRMKAPKGKVVKTLHHVGDRIWRFLEKG